MIEPERHNYIDALRVIAVALLVVFHTGLIFTPFYTFVITNDERSLLIGTFPVAFLHLWHMPLFFLLAGASAWFSLSSRTGRQYVRERVLRLFVPFVIGFVLLVPPQVYCDRVSRGYFSGSLFEFYPVYFTEGFSEGYITWHHLWFLLYLFTLSLAALPVFLFLRSRRSMPALERLAAFLSKRGAIFPLAVPLMVTEVALRARWPGYYNLVGDWANVTLFTILLIYGFILVSDRRIVEAVGRQWKIALAPGAAITSVLLALVWMVQARPAPGYDNPLYYPYTAAMAFAMWCWLVGLLGLGYRLLNRRTAFLTYAGEIAYPYYILHQPILVAIGFYVIRLDLSIAAKFLLIAIPTVFLTAAACEAVRVNSVMRFMFGVKPVRAGQGK